MSSIANQAVFVLSGIEKARNRTRILLEGRIRSSLIRIRNSAYIQCIADPSHINKDPDPVLVEAME